MRLQALLQIEITRWVNMRCEVVRTRRLLRLAASAPWDEPHRATHTSLQRSLDPFREFYEALRVPGWPKKTLATFSSGQLNHMLNFAYVK